MGYIYKITNNINNKVYIGQTVNTIEHRWKQHLESSEKDYNYILYLAIKKYGKENFKVEQIEECNNANLNDREKYWIKVFNSYYKNGYGYNMTYGGDGVVKYSDKDILQLWNQGLKANQIAKNLGANPGTISERLKTLLPPNAARQRYADFNKKTVLQYDLNGNFIKQWDCAKNIEQTLHLATGTISRCCNKQRTVCNNYLWKFSTDNTTIEQLMIRYAESTQCHQVDLIDKDGNVLKTFPSAAVAEKEYNISRGAISAVCNHKNKTAGKQHWQWSYPLKRQLIDLN